ncbi:MAG TPA: winged helix DNA-binding domain-containing protein [Mycobacteriales bacterium]
MLTLRELNRATLARQLLLDRASVGVTEAVARLGGVQAQEPHPPYLGLWTRVDGFRREDLTAALRRREVVRVTWIRGTLHLVARDDYVAWRQASQPVLTEGLRVLGKRAEGLDVPALLTTARDLLAERPLTFAELRPLLHAAFPAVDERALGFAVRMYLPLAMVPTDHRWGFPSVASFTPAESWLGRPLTGDGDPGPMVLRYLAAFGPASVADVQAWSGLSGLRPVLDGLPLEVLTDERGRELFDVPGAPRPAGDTPAPPRFLPEFDNLVLGHADRTRIVPEAYRDRITTKNLRVRATFTWDGFVAGTWTVERKRGTATLVLAPFEPLPADAVEPLTAEAGRLLGFDADDASRHAVEISPAGSSTGGPAPRRAARA